MLERFKAGYEHFLGLEPLPGVDSPTDPATDDEHRAVLELLIATTYADGLVTEIELGEIEVYAIEHGWDNGAFSFTQGLGPATARVRDARESPEGIDALIADASRRITNPATRSTVATACRLVAAADDATDDAEASFVAKVEAAFGR